MPIIRLIHSNFCATVDNLQEVQKPVSDRFETSLILIDHFNESVNTFIPSSVEVFTVDMQV